jgi:ABC-type nitrate/sulfonate/bicarbonate transport system substrate-binding protein
LDKIRLGYAAKGGGTAPVWTAYEAGIFKRLDIDLETTLIPGSHAVSAALDAGEIQLANFAAPAAVQRDLQLGSDQIVILGAMNRLVQSLVARPGISTLEQLRGGTVGIPSRDEVDYRIIQAVLPRIGFELGKDLRVEIVGRWSGDKRWLTPDLRVDSLVLHPPDPDDAAADGWTTVFDMRTLNLPFQLGCATGKRSWIAAHPELIRRYCLGHMEGILLFKTDRKFAIEVLKKYSPTDDEAVLDRSYDGLVEDFSNTPYPDPERIRNILLTMEGEVPGADASKAADFIDDSYMRELDAAGELAKLRARYNLEP